MVWKKKPEKIARILLMFALFIISANIAVPTIAQTNNTEQKGWSDEQWEKAKEGLDYNEKTKEEKKKKKDDTITEKTEPDWNISETLSKIFNSDLGKIISILLIIGLLVFTAIKLLAEKSNSANKKISPANFAEDFEELEDNLPETDLEKFLRLALEKGNYKQAIRILFLTTIQKLDENHLIQWKKDKTNLDYLREMRHHNTYRDFRELTLVYEIIWYGDTAITAEVYEKLNPVFNNYNSELKSESSGQK